MLVESVLYCGEKEFYEARLEYLSEVVDKFIVIESKSYHNGEPREVTFEEDFKDHPLRDRIIYRLIDCNDCFNDPLYQKYNGGKNFARENYHRNYVKEICKEMEFDLNTKVIIADIDEIPRREAINVIKEQEVISKQKGYVFFGMKMYYYNRTCLLNVPFYQSVITTVRWILNCPNISKQIRITTANNVFIHNAGWHLSYFMQSDKIMDKVKHFLHNNWYDIDNLGGLEYINKCIQDKKSLIPNRGDEFITEEKPDIPEIFLKFENNGDQL